MPDVFVAQLADVGPGLLAGARSVACECTAQQEATHNAMRRAGQRISVCLTVREVLIALRHFGFSSFTNAADALALEYEIRVDTGEQAPRTPKPPAKPRARRATQGQIASWHAAGRMAAVIRVERLGDATLYPGDCRDVLPTLEGVDAVVTDPALRNQLTAARCQAGRQVNGHGWHVDCW